MDKCYGLAGHADIHKTWVHSLKVKYTGAREMAQWIKVVHVARVGTRVRTHGTQELAGQVRQLPSGRRDGGYLGKVG